MYNPLVSVIIVSFNAKHFLPKCLASLIKGTYKNIEILFVDNASTDGTVQYLKKYYPKIKILQNSKNLGFSPAHEGILAHVKGEAVLLLNTDTIIETNLISELVKALYREKDIGAVQPKILMYPKKERIDSIGSFFLFNGLLYHLGYDKDSRLPIYNQSLEIFSIKGAIVLVRKEVLKKVSFPASNGREECIFDLSYFTAFEDTDLSHRIWLAGYKILYIPTALGYHIGGGTNNKVRKSFIIFHSEKNRLATYIKNLSIKYLFKVLPLIIFMYEVTTLLHVLMGRFAIALAIQRAILWNIIHLKRTLEKRKYVQTFIRAVRDDDFLPKLTKPVRLSYYYYLLTGLKSYKD